MIAATILVGLLGLFLLFLFAGTGSANRGTGYHREPMFTGFWIIWLLSAGVSIGVIVVLVKLAFAAIDYLNRH